MAAICVYTGSGKVRAESSHPLHCVHVEITTFARVSILWHKGGIDRLDLSYEIQVEGKQRWGLKTE